jgi:hypothetical protein
MICPIKWVFYLFPPCKGVVNLKQKLRKGLKPEVYYEAEKRKIIVIFEACKLLFSHYEEQVLAIRTAFCPDL